MQQGSTVKKLKAQRYRNGRGSGGAWPRNREQLVKTTQERYPASTPLHPTFPSLSAVPRAVVYRTPTVPQTTAEKLFNSWPSRGPSEANSQPLVPSQLFSSQHNDLAQTTQTSKDKIYRRIQNERITTYWTSKKTSTNMHLQKRMQGKRYCVAAAHKWCLRQEAMKQVSP